MSSQITRIDRETRRTQLLEAAVDAFRERGVTGASVDDIVRRMSVRRGSALSGRSRAGI